MKTNHNIIEDSAWRQYRHALLRFVKQRVGDAAAAEDIVQDVFVKAYARQGSLEEPSKLQPWLYQITRNAIIDHYRLQKPLRTLPYEFMQEDRIEKENSAKLELAQCLIPLLDTLPDSYRQALMLAEFEGAKQREIASQLGLSLSGAKSRVQRGRKMLRHALLKCCRVELDHRGYAVDYEVGDGCGRCSTPNITPTL